MHKEILRPKKVYSMLANRACRASIMVGRDLDHKTMKKVVTNLTSLESPYNCPHGRPTLRFLKKLNDRQKKSELNDMLMSQQEISAEKCLPTRGRVITKLISKFPGMAY